jgi:hypothetical protein
MRRYAPFAMFLLIPAFAAVSLLSGCGGGEEKKQDPAPSAERKEKKKKGGQLAELDAPTDGVLKGRVVLDGPTPKIEPIVAMAAHNDKAVCLAGNDAEKNDPTWILAPDNKGVANVVIKLVPPEGKKFKKIDPAQKEVEIDQPHCAFVPHVVALVPGQILKIKNSASVVHNTKMGIDPTANAEFDQSIQPRSFKTVELNPQKAPVRVGCSFHSWMTGLVYVADHPYIAVTKEDGTFEIPNVPTGVELTVVGIHESGDVDGGKDGKKMTFTKGDNQLDLKVKAR